MLTMEPYLLILENTEPCEVAPGFVAMFSKAIISDKITYTKPVDNTRLLKVLNSYAERIKNHNFVDIHTSNNSLTLYDQLAHLLMFSVTKNLITEAESIDPLAMILTKCKYYTFSILADSCGFKNDSTKIELMTRFIDNTIAYNLFVPHSNWMDLTNWQHLWVIPSQNHLECTGKILKLIDSIQELIQSDIDYSVSLNHTLKLLGIDKQQDPANKITAKMLILEMLKEHYPDFYRHLEFAMSLTNDGRIYEYPEIISSAIKKERPDAPLPDGFVFN